MEIRVLRYFVTMAREGNMTRAAERLFVTQPTLSKQLKDLEEELGRKLYERTNYSIRLTDAGMLLRKRAEDILALVDKTEEEFRALNDLDSGSVSIGAAESDSIKYFARTVKRLHERYPGIRPDFVSGDADDITAKLDKGLLDFAIIVNDADLSKYNYLDLPGQDRWGLVMRRDAPLAIRKAVPVEDLPFHPLICSRQGLQQDLRRWLGDTADRLNIVATFNLAYNAGIMVREGLGYAVVFDHLIDTCPASDLCFRPIVPAKTSGMKIIWRKYQVFTPAATRLLEVLKADLEREFEAAAGFFSELTPADLIEDGVDAVDRRLLLVKRPKERLTFLLQLLNRGIAAADRQKVTEPLGIFHPETRVEKLFEKHGASISKVSHPAASIFIQSSEPASPLSIQSLP